jgi:hypothetical protein
VPVVRAGGGGVLGHEEVAGNRFDMETGVQAHRDRLPTAVVH